MMLISSRDNELVKLSVALQQKKIRDEKGLCLLEGVRLVEEALFSGWKIEEIFVEERFVLTERFAALIALAAKQNILTYTVTESVIKKMATTSSPQGVVAVVRQPSVALPEKAAGECWLLADELQDPGNFGTILRSADAAGCDGVLLSGNGVDPFGPKSVRASMGSLFHLPIAVNNDRAAVLQWIKTQQMRIFVADAGGRVPYDEADYGNGCVIVIGNEARGVAPFWREAADALISIPIYGKAESLNAAVAASLLLYEAARNRRSSH